MTEDPLLDLALRIADGHPLSSDAFNAAIGHDQGTVSRLRQIHKVAQLAFDSDDDIEVSGVHHSIRAGTNATAEIPLRWGQLEILEKIGSGAYGDVYRARDPRLGREVALKLLRERAAGQSCALVEEGHLLSRVRHPNVVTVYGADFIDGRVGLWMELISGDTLEDELQRTGPLPPAEIVRIGTTLCSALAAVHAAGLLHRDIKAQNVMRDVSGRLVLMDFGSGRTQSEVDVPDLAGTPLYLAPEVFEGAEASSRTEVYSLGVLLWHLATGGFPLAARTMGELRSLHASRSKAELPPGLGQQPLGQVIGRCLVRDPSVRYGTAKDVSAALSESTAARSTIWRRILRSTVLVTCALATPHSSLSLNDGRQATSLWPHAGFNFHGAPTSDGHFFGCGSRDIPVAVCDLSAGSVTAVKIQEDVRREPFTTMPMISPEGTRVAYRSRAHEEIKIIDILSSETTAIRVDPEMNVSLVGWQPDGSRLLVLLSNLRTNRAALLDPITSLETPLHTFDSRPDSLSLSPDGGSLAFTARGDLFMVDVQASQLTRLPVEGRTQAVTWTPDNQQLIIASVVLGKCEIHALRIDKGRWSGRHVRMEQCEDRDVALLGTSAHHIFFTKSGKPPSLYVTTFKPGTLEAGAVQWSTDGTSHNGFDWSPDGSVLAFVRFEPGQSSTGPGVIVLRNMVNGTERSILMPFLASDPVVRWAPNGRWLLLSLNGVHALFDPHTGDSGGATRVSAHGGSLMTEWAEDGKSVFYSSMQEVGSYATDTGEHVPRRLLPAMPRSMHLDRAGPGVAWSEWTENRTRIWLEPYVGGAAKAILLSESRCVTAGWLDGKVFVACTNDGSEEASLRLIDPDSGDQRYVRLPMDGVSSIRVALGTGRLAVLSRRTRPGLFAHALPSPDQY